MQDAIDQTLYDGMAASQSGDYDRAGRLLGEVLALRPDDEQAWFWLAMASSTAGEAIPRLRRVAELAPERHEVRDALGQLLMANGLAILQTDPAAARVQLVEASRIREDDERVWMGLAQIAPDELERLDHLQRVLALVPDHAAAREQTLSILARRSKRLAQEGHRAEARALLDRATALAPDDVRVWLALAFLADTPEDKLAALRRVVAIQPGHAKAWILLAGLESGAAATGAAERALAIDEAGAAAVEGVRKAILEGGVDALREGNHERASGLLALAVRHQPDNERAWVAYSQAADGLDERLRALRRVVAINPDHARAKQVLKALLLSEAAGALDADPDRARQFFRETVELDPSSEHAWLGLAGLESDPSAVRAALEAAHRANPSNGETAARLAELPPAIAAPPAGQALAARATILVVDDSPTVRLTVSLALRREGYTVVAEPDGPRALTTLEGTKADLIFLDISMPEMDGYEVCRRIRKNPRTSSVPVIMLSGKDGFFDKVRGRMAGATEYITKPFEAPVLLAAVAAHCAE